MDSILQYIPGIVASVFSGVVLWQIKESKRGWYKYAKKNRKGEVVTSCRKAHNVEKRSKCEKKWLEKKGVKRN